jgi:hypothetical protein
MTKHRLLVPHASGPSAYVGINRGTIAPYLYARGFFDAAERLLSAPGHFDDVTVYAVLYLIRHGVELSLKDILTSWGRMKQEAPRSWDHNLNDLWAAARPVVELIDAYDEETGRHLLLDLNLVSGCIDDLHEHDPRGDAFRYATSRKGATHLANVETVDKTHLQSTARILCSSLLAWVRNLWVEADNLEFQRYERSKRAPSLR